MKIVQRYESWITWSDLFELAASLSPGDPLREAFKIKLSGDRGTSVFGVKIANEDVDRIRDAANRAGLVITEGEDQEATHD